MIDTETLYYESDHGYGIIVILKGLVATSDRDNVAQIMEDAVDELKSNNAMRMRDYIHSKLEKEYIEHTIFMYTKEWGIEI